MKHLWTNLVASTLIFTFVTLPLPVGLARGHALSLTARNADELDDVLLLDSDVQELISVRDEMMQRAIDSQLTPAELKAAFDAGDEDQIALALGYSTADLKSLNYRLDRARAGVLKKFPEVEAIVASSPPSSCGINPQSASCGAERFFDNFSIYEENRARPMSCSWAAYIAALAVCTLAGPIWYWVCAFAALCSFCRGGWVDSACGNN